MNRVWAFFLLSSVVACGGAISADAGLPDAGDASQADVMQALPLLPIDKIDILVSVDNSRSMLQKQEFVAAAMQGFLTELVAGTAGAPPVVEDLHIGIVTSSLGGGGAPDVCDPNATIEAFENPQLTKFSRHNDDKGHLVNRIKPDPQNPPPSGIEDPVADAQPSNFLAWLPAGTPRPAVTPLSDPMALARDFSQLVTGAGSFGCGLEAQMESWYRFLVQPDPWDSIQLDTSVTPPAAQLVGTDATILQQRHDFLRPDSLLIVIVVTDEEDSWSDPMWLGGRGWLTRALNNTFSTSGRLPRGTTACELPVDPNNPATTGPNDPRCQWCAYKGTETDPNCATNKGLYGPEEDGLNVRYTNDMKRRYGMNPQFPIERYVDGLKSDMVPDRQGEHFTPDNKLSATYLGRKTCRNPIYAVSHPTDPSADLCNLPRNGRTPDQVLFAVIAGVPWQLLTTDPKNPNAPYKPNLSDGDWVRILGKDPAHYNYEGIDPHMIESIKPRPGIACGSGAPNNCDPFHGREYDTTSSPAGLDLQYACIFTLPRAMDCTKLPDAAECECRGGFTGPLCEPNPNDGNNLTLQTRGGALPAIRELRVAQATGDAVVGSICKSRMGDDDASFNSVFHTLAARSRAIIAAHAK
jgi:hypothetical protein